MRMLCLALLVVVTMGCSIKFTVINTVNDRNGTITDAAPHTMQWHEEDNDQKTEVAND